MPPSPARRTLALAPLLLAACSDLPVAAPSVEPVAPPALAAFDCVADVRAGSIECRPAGPAPSSGARGLLLGYQGTYVRLTSSGVSYDGTSVFRADVTVRNLLGQPIGTTDGVTPDPAGVRVFFHTGPTVTAGTGTVEVANEDGAAAFTAGLQPYFRYAEVLDAHETSAPKEWIFTMPATVENFVFTVLVSAPVPDEGALDAIDLDSRTLAVGGYHSCAISTAGDAYCWGANDDGQLGSPAADSVPRLVVGGHSWTSLTAGRYHTCGLTTAGAAYCWGDNQTGQLGTGVEDDSAVPLAVAGGRTWDRLDAGAAHTCGVTIAGDAFCWGEGTAGQLGDGGFADSGVPVAVAGGWRWASVDAGTDHSCGVTRGGAAQCWGDNAAGEMGAGTDTAGVGGPLLVAGSRSWASVSAGEDFSCGVTSLGVAMCWGLDSAGQLGNGADGGQNAPAAVAGGLAWTRVTAGRETACGITTAGAGYCWGFNNTGEIGDGTTTFSDAPVAVSGGYTWRWIDGGDYHTCGIRTTGEARCWGYNLQGQLGDGTTGNDPFTGVVAGGITWAQ